jgi:hypothetical protein
VQQGATGAARPDLVLHDSKIGKSTLRPSVGQPESGVAYPHHPRGAARKFTHRRVWNLTGQLQ